MYFLKVAQGYCTAGVWLGPTLAIDTLPGLLLIARDFLSAISDPGDKLPNPAAPQLPTKLHCGQQPPTGKAGG
jgi:hypothetical protein